MKFIKKIFASNQGFTLLEMLICLLVMTLIVHNILMFMKVVKKFDYTFSLEQQLITASFQMNDDMLLSKNIICSGKTFMAETYSNNQIIYSFNGEKLVRQVNFSGHVIMLYDVQNLRFFEQANYCIMEVVDERQKKHQMVVGQIIFK
ncbi:MAG: competence type IV pilus minor pilin ComGF [Mycoplasmatales bacterium]